MQKTILAIYAHPDDEAFGTGGTLAKYAKDGHTVKLICATRGEGGKITDPDIDTTAGIAKLRELELVAACESLGIDAPIFLDYHDSGRYERTRHDDPKALMNVDEFTLEQTLLEFIKDIKPDVMITFDPHGAYGHIDHIKIHRATNAAFWSASNYVQPAPARLYYTALSAQRIKDMQERRGPSPMSDLDPNIYGVSDSSFAAVIPTSEFAAQKQGAIKAHRSQVGPQSSFASMTDDMWNAMFAQETFTLGGLRGAHPPTPSDCLLKGL